MPTCSACGQDNSDVARFCFACGAALEPPAPERRKLATLLFCDVTGSTALGERTDAETVRELMFRYFHEMRAAIERHGGTVEKFAGDAVMAAFGVPETHEDDALRACRAALEMQERVAALAPELERRFSTRLEARIGVNTGEVVAGARRDTFATGDAVNVAARLEQAAKPGEVLVGEPTLALVRDAVDVEPVTPVQAKGKAEPLPAFRLLSVATRAPLPAGAPAFVGRREELQSLLQAFEAAVRERRTRLVTIVGEPGVGKSRLVAEVERGVSARVLRGRCLAYGDGITFWPLAEIVREAASIRDEDTVDTARAKLEALAEPEVAPRIAALVGLGGTVAAEEVGWAVRRFLARLAAEQPLVLLVEDIHWGEPTLLDLLTSLERLEAPVLALATARPELFEHRPQWPGVVRLDPLAAQETTNLLRQLLDREPDAELVQRAGGNPLFVHELAALLRDRRDPAALPASLNALLAARLDRLPTPERDAVERASVEGELFHRGAVAALLETDVRVASERVAALVEREFAFPAEARLVDEAAFRFRHVLVRDAAYGGLVKRLRAALHERLADWLEAKAGDRLAEVEEIVGYHLEQAVRYGEELGLEVEVVRVRAADRFDAAGRRAADRGDVPAAVNLLQRAVDLTLGTTPVRAERLLRLADILFSTGGHARREATFDEAMRIAHALGDSRLEVRILLDRETHADRTAVAERAIPVLEEAGDDAGLARAWSAIADGLQDRLRWRERHEVMLRAVQHAERAGDERWRSMLLARMAGGFLWGPFVIDETRATMLAGLADQTFPRQPRAVWLAFLGELTAQQGDIAVARRLCADGRAIAEEIGNVIAVYMTTQRAVQVELIAGDLEEAERLGRQHLEHAERIDIPGWVDGAREVLARVLLARGGIDEAAALLSTTEPEDRFDPALDALVRAPLLARTGDLVRAEALATEAVTELDATDAAPLQADALRVLGDILRRCGTPDRAREALDRALELEERRGAKLLAEQTRALIRDIG